MNTHHYLQEPQRILGIFAHPDDEVFCAGGMLAFAAAKGIETMVVSATRGEAGQIRDAQIATRRTLGEVREQELYRSGEQLGIDEIICLDYGDGTLASVEQKVLVEELTYIIRRFRPDIVITFGPDGAYGHPDHIAIGAATTEAVKLAGDDKQFPEHFWTGLSPHEPEQLYYSYFPRKQHSLSQRLAQWLVQLSKPFQGTVGFAHALLLLSEEATMLGYTSDYVETKWFPSGFHIVEQDESASKLYLILSGNAEVYRQDSDGEMHLLTRIGPGCFFGEQSLAYQQASNAHVVADGDVTCLVFSPKKPTYFAGRGAGAQPADASTYRNDPGHPFPDEMTSVDVADYVHQKAAALAAHRTQFSFEPGMLPNSILRELLEKEYFIQANRDIEMERDSLSIAEFLPAHEQTPIG